MVSCSKLDSAAVGRRGEACEERSEVYVQGLVAVRMTAWRQLLLAMADTHITGASIRAAV